MNWKLNFTPFQVTCDTSFLSHHLTFLQACKHIFMFIFIQKRHKICSMWFIQGDKTKTAEMYQLQYCTLKTSFGWRSYGVFRLMLLAPLPKAKYIISHHCLLTCYAYQDHWTWWWHGLPRPTDTYTQHIILHGDYVQDIPVQVSLPLPHSACVICVLNDTW